MYSVAQASNFVWTFTTASEPCAPPTVISVTPPTLAAGICPSTAVTATFSEAINPATINTTTFTLTAGTPPVAVTGVVTYAASTATFTPNSALAVSTPYTATITTGAQNLNGNALASNYGWTFTTASSACVPPTVISVAPPNGATGICPNTLVDRHLQRSDEVFHDQYHNLYLDRAGPYGGGWSSYLCCVKRCRDLHTHQPSRTGHPLYRHHYHGGSGSRWRSTSKRLCMDLHHSYHAMSSHRTVGIGLQFRNSGRLHGHQLRSLPTLPGM